MANSAVELAVGARPNGQASFSTPTSMTISLFLASVDSLLPVNEITVQPIPRILATSAFNSSVSPLLSGT